MKHTTPTTKKSSIQPYVRQSSQFYLSYDQAIYLRNNSEAPNPSSTTFEKNRIQNTIPFSSGNKQARNIEFCDIFCPWVRVLAYAQSLFAVKTSLSSLFLLKIFHDLYSTASWLNLFLASILWLYETIQLNIWKSKK